MGFKEGNGPLHRTHPLTAMTLVAFVGAGVFTAAGLWNVSFLLFVLVLIVAERTPGVFKTAASLAAPFWVLLLLIHGVLGGSWERAVVLSVRITTMLSMFVLFLASVHPSRLVEALIHKRIPFSVAFLFAAALQAVPDLKDRAAAVLEAQRCRGVKAGGSILNRVRVIMLLTIPLVIGSLITLDEKTVALETRGALGGTGVHKTPLHPPEDGAAGKIVRWLALVAILVMLGRVVTG